MIRGAGRYSTLITPTAGSLFHAEFHSAALLSVEGTVAAGQRLQSRTPATTISRGAQGAALLSLKP